MICTEWQVHKGGRVRYLAVLWLADVVGVDLHGVPLIFLDVQQHVQQKARACGGQKWLKRIQNCLNLYRMIFRMQHLKHGEICLGSTSSKSGAQSLVSSWCPVGPYVAAYSFTA